MRDAGLDLLRDILLSMRDAGLIAEHVMPCTVQGTPKNCARDAGLDSKLLNEGRGPRFRIRLEGTRALTRNIENEGRWPLNKFCVLNLKFC